MSFGKALVSGLVGACALTILHETARQFIEDSPRLDILGERAISKSLAQADIAPLAGDDLYWLSLGGDIVSNTLYYSLIGLSDEENVYQTAALLGLAAGLGSIVLPKPLGLGENPTARTRQTEMLTVAWYLTGSLAAAATYRYLSEEF